MLKDNKKLNNELENRLKPYYNFAKKYLELNYEDLILDVGCGTAEFCIDLFKETKKVIGVDISKESLREAKKKSNELILVLGSIFHLPFKDNIFTKCTALEILEHLGHKNKILQALKEVNRVIGRQKIFVLTTPNKGRFLKYVFFDPASWIGKHHHFSKDGLSMFLLKSNFKLEKINTIGGSFFVIFFYTFFWRIRNLGLLKFKPINDFFKLIVSLVELEFKEETQDGCMFIVKAKKQDKRLLKSLSN